MYEKFPNLLMPLQVGKLTVKNRLAVAPMGLMELFDQEGIVNDTGMEFFAERAKGGFGLITLPAVHPDQEIDPVIFKFPENKTLYIQRSKMLLDRCHAYGAKVFIQISFGLGRNGMPGCKSSDETPYYFAPDTKTPALTTEEIKRKIALVVEMAKFLKDTGFDGVEMHAMHWGYLLDQLAMSITNHRTDEYGGSLENRLRAAKELVLGIKEVCGKDFPVCMRLGLRSFITDLYRPDITRDDSKEAGRTLEEAVEIAKLLEEYGYDLLSVDLGIYDSFYYMLPPAYIEYGVILPYVEAVKKAVSIPVIAAGGRMNDPRLSDHAIGEGRLDGLVLGRQSLADPYYPSKVETGKIEKIRPCIACNAGCNGEGSLGKYTCCAVNPQALKEDFMKIEPAQQRKKIAVIGGGTAGMEFARTARLRGHEVELYEKEEHLGGLLIPAGNHDFKSEVKQLNQWYQNELKDLNIPVHTGMEMRAEDIKALDADTIVLTVGAEPIMPPIPGIHHPKTVDCVKASMNQCETGDKVAIIGGGLTGCEIALDMARKRKKVTVVDALDELMTGTAFPNKLMLLDYFKHYNVEILTGHRIKEINDTGAVVTGKDNQEKTVQADYVIMSIGFKPRKSMASELYGEGKEVYSLVTGTRSIMTSVRDAFEVARKV